MKGRDVQQIPVFDVRVEHEDLDAVAEVLRSGWLSAGPRTEAFERRSPSISAPATSSPSRAAPPRFHLACIAAGIEPATR